MVSRISIFGLSLLIILCQSNEGPNSDQTEINTHSALWVLWLFVGSCLIVILVGCAAFDRFKAEFLRLKILSSIRVDFNHTKEDEADDEVSDDEKVEELHYKIDKKEEKNVNVDEDTNKSNVRLSAKQNMEKLLELMNDTMTTTVHAAKKEMNRMRESVRAQLQKHSMFDGTWAGNGNDVDMMVEEEDNAVI